MNWSFIQVSLHIKQIFYTAWHYSHALPSFEASFVNGNVKYIVTMNFSFFCEPIMSLQGLKIIGPPHNSFYCKLRIFIIEQLLLMAKLSVNVNLIHPNTNVFRRQHHLITALHAVYDYCIANGENMKNTLCHEGFAHLWNVKIS